MFSGRSLFNLQFVVEWTAGQQLLWLWAISHCCWKAGAAPEHPDAGISSLTAQLRGLNSYRNREWESPGLVWITSETFRCCSKSPWPGNPAGKFSPAVWFFKKNFFFAPWQVFQSFLALAGMAIPQEWSSSCVPEVSFPVPPQAGVWRSRRKRQKNQPLLDPTGAWMFSLCSLAGGSVPVKNSFSQQTLLQPLIWSHTFIIFPPLRFLRPLQSNWIKKIILFDLGFRLKGSDFLSLHPSVKVPLQPKDDFIYRCALHLWIEAAEETRGVLRSLSTEAIPRFWGSPWVPSG